MHRFSAIGYCKVHLAPMLKDDLHSELARVERELQCKGSAWSL